MEVILQHFCLHTLIRIFLFCMSLSIKDVISVYFTSAFTIEIKFGILPLLCCIIHTLLKEISDFQLSTFGMCMHILLDAELLQ